MPNKLSGYAALLQALEALPNKRLIRGSYWDGADGCALGSCVRRAAQSADLNAIQPHYCQLARRLFGLGFRDVDRVMQVNDWLEDSPEERYARVLEWLRAEVNKEHP